MKTKTKTKTKMKKLIEIARFKLAGVQYSDYQRCKKLKAGAKVAFYWEPNNKFDSKAIRVDCDGVKIGYVPGSSDDKELLHEYRENKLQVTGEVVAYNATNTTWNMITVKAMSYPLIEKSKSSGVSFAEPPQCEDDYNGPSLGDY